MILNELEKLPGYLPSPSETVRTLWGRDYAGGSRQDYAGTETEDAAGSWLTRCLSRPRSR